MFLMWNVPDQPASAKIVWIVAAAIAIASWHSGAIPADEQQPTRLSAQASQAHVGVNRDPARAAIERLSEHEIKAFYVRCSQEVIERRFPGGASLICSIAYDVLLKKHFSGNFNSLLAWSRAQRTNPAQVD